MADKPDPSWIAPFLAALAETGIASQAATAAGTGGRGRGGRGAGVRAAGAAVVGPAVRRARI